MEKIKAICTLANFVIILIIISLAVFIWGVITDTSWAITGGLVFSGCCIGTYVGSKLKKR